MPVALLGASPFATREEMLGAMGIGRNELPFGGPYEAGCVGAPRLRQYGSRHDEWSVRAAMGLLYAPMPWIMRLIVTVHFRRLRVRHRDRLPARGAVLIVANHPAAWMDVVVLGTALGRKLSFLAHESLFRPRARAWILRLYGALPVAKPGDPPGRATRNALTFMRCHTLLARGEVVAVFPEGLSAGDRSVGPFRTGAARIALDHIANGGSLALIPVGIHYADRTAFRSDVVVSVGRPLHLKDVPVATSRDARIEGLTSRLRMAIAGLIVDLPDPSLRWLVEELAPHVHSADAGAFENLRRVARRIAHLRQRSPRAFAVCELNARSHRRLRTQLHVSPGDLTAGSEVALTAFTAIVALPAVAGVLLNAPPAVVTAMVAIRFSDPARVGMARIVAGIVCFGAWYAATAIVVAWTSGSAWMGLAAMFAMAGLGMFALNWEDAWSRVRRRMWVMLLQWWQPRLVAHLRREHETLRQFREWLVRSPRRRSESIAEGAIS